MQARERERTSRGTGRAVAGAILLALVLAACSDAPAPLDPATLTIAEMHAALRDGRTTCVEIARRSLARIAALDDAGPALNAVLETNPDALAIAAELDAAYAERGPVGPLHCVPLAVKDNYGTGDRMRTTAASLTMGDFVAREDALSIAKLRAAGALPIAKVNMDEFATGATGYSSRGGQTLGAYKLNRIPGGSSGGSAVAVAAGMAVLATGSDTAGSIRIPAAFNSLVGIKPTLGLIGRSGIVPASLDLDVPGPLARTVTDAAIALGAMTGIDPGDPATEASAGRFFTDYTPFLDPDGLRGARLGVLRELLGNPLGGLNPEVDATLASSLAAMGAHGATLVDPTTVPHVVGEDDFFEMLVVLGSGSFAPDVDAYFATDGAGAPVRSAEDILRAARALGPDVVKNLPQLEAAVATVVTPEQRAHALALRARLVDAVVGAMDAAGVEALVFPTLLCPATPLPGVIDPDFVCVGAPPMPYAFGEAFGGDPILLASLAGLPEITVPAGYTRDGAPIGVSFLGRPFSEPTLLRLAYAFEQATQARRPPSFGSSAAG